MMRRRVITGSALAAAVLVAVVAPPARAGAADWYNPNTYAESVAWNNAGELEIAWTLRTEPGAWNDYELTAMLDAGQVLDCDSVVAFQRWHDNSDASNGWRASLQLGTDYTLDCGATGFTARLERAVPAPDGDVVEYVSFAFRSTALDPAAGHWASHVEMGSAGTVRDGIAQFSGGGGGSRVLDVVYEGDLAAVMRVTCTNSGGAVTGYPRDVAFEGPGAARLDAPIGSDCAAELIADGAVSTWVGLPVTIVADPLATFELRAMATAPVPGDDDGAVERPANETPGDEAPDEETPIEDSGAPHAPSDELPSEEESTGEPPTAEQPAVDAPADDAPEEDVPAPHAPSHDADGRDTDGRDAGAVTASTTPERQPAAANAEQTTAQRNASASATERSVNVGSGFGSFPGAASAATDAAALRQLAWLWPLEDARVVATTTITYERID